MIVYKAEDKRTGFVYIGKTTLTLEKRKYQHIYKAVSHIANCPFYKALRNIGEKVLWDKKDNPHFEWSVIFETDDKLELNRAEMKHINEYAEKGICFNVVRKNQAV